ncbi:uncharacterized protein LOC108666335 [Hyalella azteca]|uniref:Uncharacterized protein LOC108666335 n=1 Tax=Hyalella azteca TaxID=294128 RepID=A0A979FIA6_HYAAZ|nr:uncharacterized protein LOC108666335 [Hyalella azteca]
MIRNYLGSGNVRNKMENGNAAPTAVLASDPWSLQATGVTSSADDTSRLCLVTEPDDQGGRDVLGLSVDVSNRRYSSYKSAPYIGRCIHIDDAILSCSLKCLTPHHLFNKANDELSNTTVLWTEPVRDARRHNIFGNVTFTVAWSDMYRQFGPNMYYLRQRTSHNITTEILITKKRFNTLELVDFNAKNAPVRRGECNCASESKMCNCGSLKYATKIRRGKSSIRHHIQIAVDATIWEGFWVYALSTIVLNDHQHNKFCFRQEYVKPKRPCQFYCDASQVQTILWLQCHHELDEDFRREWYDRFWQNWMHHFESYSQSLPYYFK